MALETVPANPRSIDSFSSPRISFSSDFLDETNFISINPHSPIEKKPEEKYNAREKARDFEFLSSKVSSYDMLSADELFSDGKLLPFWQMQQSEKLNKINLKPEEEEEEDEEEEVIKEESNNNRVKNNNNNNNNTWFVDDDPSPRPPTCTVLWKELLRLKKQKASSLSPSSSSSSSSSSSTSSSSTSSLSDIATKEEGNKHVKRIKKGLERTRSASIRIRPMINVPICTQMKNSSLPPLFPLKKGRLDR